MIEIYIVIALILLFLNFLFFGVGYILGKINSTKVIESQSKSFFSQNLKSTEDKKEKITIDERKHVVDIKTSGLEKKYDTLGETKKSDENIESSINKLKNLKR